MMYWQPGEKLMHGASERDGLARVVGGHSKYQSIPSVRRLAIEPIASRKPSSRVPHRAASLRGVAEGQVAIGNERAKELRLVAFHLRDQEFGLPIESVRETLRVPPITRVFLTPTWLAGIFSLRGEIVPAIDIALWFGMPPTSVTDESRLVVLRHATTPVGILATRLAELRTVSASDLSEPPSTLSLEQAALLSKVAVTESGTVRILDPEAILSSDWMRALKNSDH